MEIAERAAPQEHGWQRRLLGEHGPEGAPLNVSSQGLVASMVVKAGAGSLYNLTAVNTALATVFVQLFDTQTPLANGMAPVVVVQVAASSNMPPLSYGLVGRAFAQGMAVASSSTVATLTLTAATAWFDAQYL